jgi:hypothetical protein
LRAREDDAFDAPDEGLEDARDPLVGLLLLAIPQR